MRAGHRHARVTDEAPMRPAPGTHLSRRHRHRRRGRPNETERPHPRGRGITQSIILSPGATRRLSTAGKSGCHPPTPDTPQPNTPVHQQEAPTSDSGTRRQPSRTCPPRLLDHSQASGHVKSAYGVAGGDRATRGT
jgi:hypothetical protein